MLDSKILAKTLRKYSVGNFLYRTRSIGAFFTISFMVSSPTVSLYISKLYVTRKFIISCKDEEDADEAKEIVSRYVRVACSSFTDCKVV